MQIYNTLCDYNVLVIHEANCCDKTVLYVHRIMMVSLLNTFFLVKHPFRMAKYSCKSQSNL